MYMYNFYDRNREKIIASLNVKTTFFIDGRKVNTYKVLKILFKGLLITYIYFEQLR